jgi:hypothetical protein
VEKIHNVELLDLYSSPTIISHQVEEDEIGWACSTNMEKGSVHSLLVEGRRPVGKPKHRWLDNIKMDLTDTGWGGLDLIDVIQDRDKWRDLVNAVMNLLVPKKILENCPVLHNRCPLE